MIAELLMVEQREGAAEDDSAHWILEGGRILPGVDYNRRMEELRNGLLRHERARAAPADADSEEVEQTLSVLHEPDYLEALAEVSAEPVVIPELTPPGLPPDIPVCSGLVAAAREGVRTAITAAERRAEAPASPDALCRPPATTRARPGSPATATSTRRQPPCRPCASSASSRSASSTSICTAPTARRRSSPRWKTRACTRCTPRR